MFRNIYILFPLTLIDSHKSINLLERFKMIQNHPKWLLKEN
jgi:hypothetical protein